MKSDDSTFGYVSVNALMEFARNHVDRKVDCNDIARFPRSNVRNADEQQSLQQIFGIPFARLRELAEADRKGKIKIGSDWIPCAERLPEYSVGKCEEYLVTVRLKTNSAVTFLYVATYSCGQWNDTITGDALDDEWEVIAWKTEHPYRGDHFRDTTKKVQEATNE